MIKYIRLGVIKSKKVKKVNFVKYSEKMIKGYIKKEWIRLLNTKVFFLNIVKEITHIVHRVSHSVDMTGQRYW